MICLQCGTCCVTMPCAVSNGDTWFWKPGNVICPHLEIFSETVTCRVHNEPWYVDTPCFIYGNPDSDPDFIVKQGKPCNIGTAYKIAGGFDFSRYEQPAFADLKEIDDIIKEALV